MYNNILFMGYDIKIQSRNKKVGKNSGNRRCQKLEIQWVIRMKIGDMREFIKNLDDNTEIEFEYHGKKMKIVKKDTKASVSPAGEYFKIGLDFVYERDVRRRNEKKVL